MGIIARQSLYNAAYTYIGIALGAVTTLFLYPYILEADQYGLTRILLSASIIGAQFAHLGIRNVVIRFFPLFKNPEKGHRGLLFIATIVPLAGFLAFSILVWIFRDSIIGFYADRSPLFVEFFYYILPITFFILYFEVLNSYLRSLRDSTTGSLVNEVILRVSIILLLCIYFTGWISFDLFILFFTICYGLQPILLFLALYQTGELKLSPRFSFMRTQLIRGMSSYGFYTLLGGLTTVIVWNVDIMMLGSMSGLEQTAVYAIAFYIGSVITVPQRAIDKIATPLIADYLQKKDWVQVEEIYKKSSLNQLIGGILILSLIWVNIDALLALLPEVYAGGRRVVLFIGLGKLFDMATGTNGSIIITSRYYKFDLFTNLLLVFFTISTNLLLIPNYGIVGAAIATMLSILAYNLIKFIFVWIKFSMQPFKLAALWALVFGSVAVFVALSLPALPLIMDVGVRSLSILLLFLLPVWWFELSPDINRLTARVLRLLF
ncbi:MAG: polysaccharide biosynthesis C-terminal domain-containing protein [Balneolaceae bacterium]